MVKKNKQANKIAEMHGDEGMQDETLYQFHKEEEIVEGIMGIYKEKAVREGIAYLRDVKGCLWVGKNPNPRYAFDKTNFFLLNPEIIQTWLDERRSRNGNNAAPNGEKAARYGKKGAAIPEITSETTSDISKKEIKNKEKEIEQAESSHACSKSEKGNHSNADTHYQDVSPSPQCEGDGHIIGDPHSGATIPPHPTKPKAERVGQSASDALKGSADSSGGGSQKPLDTRYRHATSPKNVGGGHELADNRELRAPASQPCPNGKGGHFSADALSYNAPPSPYREPQQRNDSQDKFEFGQMMQGFATWEANQTPADTHHDAVCSDAAKKAGGEENSHVLPVTQSGGAKIPPPASTAPLRANLCTFADLLPTLNEEGEEKCSSGGDQHCFDALSSHVAPIQSFGGESPIGVDTRKENAISAESGEGRDVFDTQKDDALSAKRGDGHTKTDTHDGGAIPSSRPPSDANLEALLERASHLPFASDDIEIPENDPTGLTARLERLNPYKSSKISAEEDFFDDDTPKAPVASAEASLGEKGRPVCDAPTKTVSSPKNKTLSQVHCTAQNEGGRSHSLADTLTSSAPSAPVYTISLSDAEAFVKEYGFKAFVNETGRLINARRLAT